MTKYFSKFQILFIEISLSLTDDQFWVVVGDIPGSKVFLIITLIFLTCQTILTGIAGGGGGGGVSSGRGRSRRAGARPSTW